VYLLRKKSVSWIKFILLKNAFKLKHSKNRSPVTTGGPDWGTLGKHIESEDKLWNPLGYSFNN
jgi:hypothetical protein